MFTIPRTLSRNGWLLWHLVGAMLLAALAAWACGDAWSDIARIAQLDEEASQIFLVPVVVAWLLWVRKDRVRFCRPSGLWIGPVLVAIGWALHSSGDFYLIQAFWHGGAVLVACGALLTFLGSDVLFRFLPAFAVLIFLIPVPGMFRQAIAIPLQTTTAHATQAVLDAFGLPITRSGNVLTINGVDVAIAEACNGLRMVFALVLVSYAFAFGTPLRTFARLLILILSPISAILCNVIRLVPTVWLYGQSPQWGDLFHDVSGWVMLPIAFLILWGVIKLLRWAMVPVTRFTLAYDL